MQEGPRKKKEFGGADPEVVCSGGVLADAVGLAPFAFCPRRLDAPVGLRACYLGAPVGLRGWVDALGCFGGSCGAKEDLQATAAARSEI